MATETAASEAAAATTTTCKTCKTSNLIVLQRPEIGLVPRPDVLGRRLIPAVRGGGPVSFVSAHVRGRTDEKEVPPSDPYGAHSLSGQLAAGDLISFSTVAGHFSIDGYVTLWTGVNFTAQIFCTTAHVRAHEQGVNCINSNGGGIYLFILKWTDRELCFRRVTAFDFVPPPVRLDGGGEGKGPLFPAIRRSVKI